MKKLLSLVVLSVCFFNCSAFAASLDERIAKVEARYEQKVQKIDASRYKAERKEVLKKHAKQDADLKIQHLKDLEALKNVKTAKNVKKVTKKAKTSKKVAKKSSKKA